MNPAASWLLLRVAPTIAYAYIRLLHATMKIEVRGAEALAAARRDPGKYILCFWHSRFLLMPYSYPGPRIVVLSSLHRDAEALVRILRKFGIEQARGSSTRGGMSGMRQILRKVEDGCDVGMTPDGPKGPRRRVQPGVVAVARFTGLPIIPVTFSATPVRRLRSWDRTMMPKLFSRGLFIYGTPIVVPRDADEAEQERKRLALEAELDRITDAADDAIGEPREEPRPEVVPA
ncbi:MAG TPA: lysophospholipid acyltransferase family protein [Candidatus Polarisedimenticolaceae bacterium]|nr:lysophospholipid acyltransferase family protein [Candidatus Polarisedimenticolaceae bacterium]